MRLTVQSDYALRLLMHLAVNEGRLSTIQEVAERYDVSKNHMMKVANRLSVLGWIETVRGRSGGMRLAKTPQSISIGPVVRALEAESALVECFQDGAGQCLITPACKLKHALAEAEEAFFRVLDGYALSDLTVRNAKLKALLFQGAA